MFFKKIDFIFPTSPDGIHEFVETTILKVSELVLLSEKICQRIRLILIELATNFIKHSLTQEGILTISIKEKLLEITMPDKGSRFFELLKRKIFPNSIGEVAEISFSDTNNHFIKIISENKFQFLNPYLYDFKIEPMKDHYGLYIITLASDYFSIYHNQTSKEAEFMISLAI